MTQPSLAVAADQADALLTLRRATQVLAALILAATLVQMTVFLGVRYWHFWPVPSAAGTARRDAADMLEYLVGLLDFAGVILPAMLAVALLVALLIQVAARLAGAGRTTTALLWAVALALLLFPWQSVLNNPAVDPKAGESAIGMKVPGAFYTWAEVSHPTLGAGFKTPARLVDGLLDPVVWLHWARYVGFPLLAIAMLGLDVRDATRGLRRALGGAATVPPTPDVPAGAVPQVAPQL